MDKASKRLAAAFLAMLMVVSIFATVFVPRQAYAADGVAEYEVSAYFDYSSARAVFNSVNSQRAANGLSSLAWDDTLTSYAMTRAVECSINFAHTRVDGTSCFTILESPYSDNMYSKGENIAFGQSDAASVMTAWMNSSGHRANILGSNYKSVGIGAVKINGVMYWVQIFSGCSSQSSSEYYTSNYTGTGYVALGETGGDYCAYRIGDYIYLFNPDGKMLRYTQWIKGQMYYMNGKGQMQTGWVQWSDKSWSYFMPDSGAAKMTWVKDSKHWYFMDPDTGKSIKGWADIDDVIYYFNGSYQMVTGWKQWSDGSWSYFKSSGAASTGWVKDSKHWYYMDSSTYASVTGWVSYNDAWYYMNSSYQMVTGWQKIDGSWYYFKSSGIMATGWAKVSGKWYYLDPSTGIMRTGLISTEKGTYYCDASGAQKTGWVKPGDGYEYYFDPNNDGLMATNTWIGKYYVDESGHYIAGYAA